MQTVRLDTEEWQKVMACISQAPWNVANPLLMKIGEQLQQQGNAKMPETAAAQGEVRVKRN